jgi:hypothetical protein
VPCRPSCLWACSHNTARTSQSAPTHAQTPFKLITDSKHCHACCHAVSSSSSGTNFCSTTLPCIFPRCNTLCSSISLNAAAGPVQCLGWAAAHWSIHHFAAPHCIVHHLAAPHCILEILTARHCVVHHCAAPHCIGHQSEAPGAECHFLKALGLTGPKPCPRSASCITSCIISLYDVQKAPS